MTCMSVMSNQIYSLAGSHARMDRSERILQFMKKQVNGRSAIQVAKALNLSNAASVNPTLHRLQRDGFLRKTDGKPPKWLYSQDRRANSPVPLGVPLSTLPSDVSQNYHKRKKQDLPTKQTDTFNMFNSASQQVAYPVNVYPVPHQSVTSAGLTAPSLHNPLSSGSRPEGEKNTNDQDNSTNLNINVLTSALIKSEPSLGSAHAAGSLIMADTATDAQGTVVSLKMDQDEEDIPTAGELEASNKNADGKLILTYQNQYGQQVDCQNQLLVGPYNQGASGMNSSHGPTVDDFPQVLRDLGTDMEDNCLKNNEMETLILPQDDFPTISNIRSLPVNGWASEQNDEGSDDFKLLQLQPTSEGGEIISETKNMLQNKQIHPTAEHYKYSGNFNRTEKHNAKVGKFTDRNNISETGLRILRHMSSNKQPVLTRTLAHALKFKTKREINPHVYDLQKLGMLDKVQDVPPSWCLSQKGHEVMSETSRVTGHQQPAQISSSLYQKQSTAPRTVTLNDFQESSFQLPPSPKTLMRNQGLFHESSVNGRSMKNDDSGNPFQQALDMMVSPDRDMRQVTVNPRYVNSSFSLDQVASLPASTSRMPQQYTAPSGYDSLMNNVTATLEKNPVSLLNEIGQKRGQSVRIEVLKASGPPHQPRFTLAAFMGGRQFPSIEASSKKEGRLHAAEKAVRILTNEGCYQPLQPQRELQQLGVAATHYDKMSSLANEKFAELMTNVAEPLAGRKVLAAIIMTCDSNEEETMVISVGMGNRCITGDYLNMQGEVVNDSHAEVIARRSFLRFLYIELQHHSTRDPRGLLETCPITSKLRIKPQYKFHLYISTAPCGDGALFTPRLTENVAVEDDSVHHPVLTSKVQGLLRTKIEGGEGTIPIDADSPGQTFDGIVRGERLRTMSCSDKVCRWNLLGLQGALLSHFLAPIYLSSLTLGYLYDHGHLSRAVCCRLDCDKGSLASQLPVGYRINHPRLGSVTYGAGQRETQKTREFSVNWCLGDRQPEVTDGCKGRLLESSKIGVSRVSKSSLYRDFQGLCGHFGKKDLHATTYHAAKQKAKEYQQAKSAMINMFNTAGFGRWMSKPPEQEQF